MVNPLPLIPPGWEEHHRPIVEGSWTAICELLQPAGPPPYGTDLSTWDPYTPLATNLPCRIQQQNNSGAPSSPATGTETRTRDYMAVLAADSVPVRAGDNGTVLRVTGFKPGYAGDPLLVGRTLRVDNILFGSLIWERDLILVDDLGENGA